MEYKCAIKMAGYLLIGSVILQAISGVQAVLDITCFVAKPRIDIARDDSLFIGGYKSGDDTGSTVTFGRTTDTGTGNGLPRDSKQRNRLSGRARILSMPQTGGVERIGAFYCEAQKGGIEERIPAIVMASNSDVTPQRISQTVSVGDDVTLSVITDKANIRWRLNGTAIGQWDDQKSVQRSDVKVSQGGIYECIQAGKRDQGLQAIFLIVVRACASRKWGLPACANDCPVCFNGGICDERSGVCVCAPGYSGDKCETVHGRNKWGQDGNLVCASKNIDACRGRLFCLPHPYGCSCGAGYRGIDCVQDCEDGTYGASCLSQCHCNQNVSCSADTGVCSDGQCHSDWYGYNCQKRCPEPQTAIGLQAEILPTMVISIQWDEVLPCYTAILRYQVYNNLEHCQERKDNTTELSSNEYDISNMQLYSNYIINLEIIRDGETESSIRESVNVTTNAKVPQIAPAFTTDPISTSDSLSFSWDAIPCESQGGPGLRYAFNLSSNDGLMMTNTTYNTTASFSNLNPCTMYKFEVRAVNDIGDGESSVKTINTKVKEPGPVNNFTISQTSSANNLKLSWTESTANMCTDDGYVIRYTLINQDQCKDEIIEMIPLNTSDLMEVLYNLHPYSTYDVSVVAINSAGEGIATSMIQITNNSVPEMAPSDFSEISVCLNRLSLQWLAPPCGSRHGDISYAYRLTNEADAVVRAAETQSKNVTIADLEEFTNYSFQVRAVTDAGNGQWSAKYATATDQAKPSAPVMFKVTHVNKTSITVIWQQPDYPNCAVLKYSVQSKIIAKPYDNTFDVNSESSTEQDINHDSLTYTFARLKPTTAYDLTLFAISAVGPGAPIVIQQFTNAATAEDIGAPTTLPKVMNSDITPTTVGISIPITTGEFVTGYQVRVLLTSRRGKRQILSFGHHGDSEESYIAAELPKDNDSENIAFVVGDNKTYGMYYNAPLIPGETFTLYTAYVSRIDNTTYEAVMSEGTEVTLPSTDKSQPSVIGPVIATVVIVVLLIVAVVLGGIVYKRRLVKKSPTSTPHSIGLTNQGTSEDTTDRAKGVQNKAFAETEASDKQIANRPSRQTNRLSLGALVGPIKLTVLEKYVNEKKDNQCKSFKVDFKTLPGDNLDSWDAAKKPENRKKNRYANITTYDKARVILETLENDPHSDYINASYIDGLYETEKYIASQGPNTRSLHDFWRMIWQHKIMKIVMLTNLVERGKGKCEKYWPDIVTEMGGVTVTPLREEEYAGYLIRFFACQKSGERRELRQYHYTTWPDMGVPNCPGPVLNFMKLVNGYIPPKDAGPPVIHCSAGVGRTGTYIAIDSLIEQGKREGAVDVFGFVSNMRRNRMNMVQTSEQYQFIFEALLEEVFCGDTSYPSTSFESEYSKLKKTDPEMGKSGLMKQFKALEKVTVRPSESKCQGGTNPINVQKNRYPDIIPTDRSRPYLMAEVDEHSTNYINAAYIDSYQVRNQHIVTQIPVPGTVPDIWRMVYDYNFHTIAMVNTLDYKDPSIAKYWPDQGQTLTFGPYTVTCVKEDERPHDVTVRTFQVFNQQDKDGERMISQISLRNWLPTEDEPGSVDSVLALMNSMKMWQKQEDCADSKRVVIQCIDGVGASCTFCAIMLVLEKLECDPNIDIFQTVRRLRTIRPQAVRNLVQYTFCYKAIEAHLRSDAIYGNL